MDKCRLLAHMFHRKRICRFHAISLAPIHQVFDIHQTRNHVPILLNNCYIEMIDEHVNAWDTSESHGICMP